MQANYQFSELIQALLTELEVKSDHVYFVHPSTDILVNSVGPHYHSKVDPHNQLENSRYDTTFKVAYARDKKKSESLAGIEPMTSQTGGRHSIH